MPTIPHNHRHITNSRSAIFIYSAEYGVYYSFFFFFFHLYSTRGEIRRSVLIYVSPRIPQRHHLQFQPDQYIQNQQYRLPIHCFDPDLVRGNSHRLILWRRYHINRQFVRTTTDLRGRDYTVLFPVFSFITSPAEFSFGIHQFVACSRQNADADLFLESWGCMSFYFSVIVGGYL